MHCARLASTLVSSHLKVRHAQGAAHPRCAGITTATSPVQKQRPAQEKSSSACISQQQRHRCLMKLQSHLLIDTQTACSLPHSATIHKRHLRTNSSACSLRTMQASIMTQTRGIRPCCASSPARWPSARWTPSPACSTLQQPSSMQMPHTSHSTASGFCAARCSSSSQTQSSRSWSASQHMSTSSGQPGLLSSGASEAMCRPQRMAWRSMSCVL